MKNKSIISLILAILLSGGALGGYKVVRDNRADTFENSIHSVVYVVDGDTILNRRVLAGSTKLAEKRKFCLSKRSFSKALEEVEDLGGCQMTWQPLFPRRSLLNKR